jgi:DHA1 family tetracycline resistance protein-like MFS transporter
VGASLAFVGVIIAVSQGVLTRTVIPRINEKRAALLGISFGAIGYAGLAFAAQGWMTYAWLMAWLVAGMVYPSLNAIMSSQVPGNAQGELQGAVGSLFSLASVIGPPLMTHLFGMFSAGAFSIHLPGAAFLCSALLVVVGALLVLRAARAGVRIPHAHEAEAVSSSGV